MKHEFERYCKDYQNIENYEKAKADDFKNWHCHHRLETHNSDGERREVDITRRELKALNMYYHRPAEELIFLPTREHHALHNKGENNPMYGKHHSDEAKKKLREANKGKKLSEETRKKMSEAKKNMSEETRRKIAEAHKGRQPMLGKHHSEEAKNKIAEAHKGNTNTKGMHWFNNSKINKLCYECPPGFVPGRLR